MKWRGREHFLALPLSAPCRRSSSTAGECCAPFPSWSGKEEKNHLQGVGRGVASTLIPGAAVSVNGHPVCAATRRPQWESVPAKVVISSLQFMRCSQKLLCCCLGIFRLE